MRYISNKKMRHSNYSTKISVIRHKNENFGKAITVVVNRYF